jgi:hypothetical protein
MYPKGTRFIVARRYYATLARQPAYRYRAAFKLRVFPYLNGRIEAIHINMNNLALCLSGGLKHSRILPQPVAMERLKHRVDSQPKVSALASVKHAVTHHGRSWSIVSPTNDGAELACAFQGLELTKDLKVIE